MFVSKQPGDLCPQEDPLWCNLLNRIGSIMNLEQSKFIQQPISLLGQHHAGHTNRWGDPCLQELHRFLEFHTSSFLPLAKGLFLRKDHFTCRVFLCPTSYSTMTPTHGSCHGSILHLSTHCSFPATGMGLRSSWLRVNQYLLLILKKGGDSIACPSHDWQRLWEGDFSMKSPAHVLCISKEPQCELNSSSL